MLSKLLATVALAMGSLSLFADAPKKEAKPETPAKTEVKSDAQAGAVLYWYEVTYDASHPSGYIAPGTPVFTHAEKGTFSTDCTPGDDIDCMRGFVSQPSLPTNNAGDDQIKKLNE